MRVDVVWRPAGRCWHLRADARAHHVLPLPPTPAPLYAQLAKLTAADAAADDYFGYSVAIDGNTVVVGAWGDDDSGSAYVFRTTDGGATYDEVAKLTAADAAAGDYFGYSVAIDGGHHCDWSLRRRRRRLQLGLGLRLPHERRRRHVRRGGQADGQRRRCGDYFGYSVAIDGDTIVVGAYGDDDAGSSSGSVYVFRTNDGGASYVEVAKLTAADAAGRLLRLLRGHRRQHRRDRGLRRRRRRLQLGLGLRLPHERRRRHVRPSCQADGRRRRGGRPLRLVRGDRRRHHRGRCLRRRRRRPGPGSAYVFHTSDGWTTHTYGQAGAVADAVIRQFGVSVAINGGTVVVGAYGLLLRDWRRL